MKNSENADHRAPNLRKIRFRRLELIRYWRYYILALPAVAVFFLFAYLPLPGIILAFKKYTVTGGIFGSPWVGFDNFKAFFTGANILRITRNILIINGGNIIVGTVSSVAGAILINELFSKRAQKIYQNILFLPTFFSALLVAKFFNLLLNNDYGIINGILKVSGLDPVMWYDHPWYWPFIIVIANTWKGLGNGLIIYLASIIAIDESVYEAARIDGATERQQIFRITLPLLKPVIVLQFLLSVGRIFSGDFLFIYSFMGDNYKLKETLDIIETYLFNNVVAAGSGNNAYVDYGMSTAIGLYQTALGFILIFTANTIVKIKDKELALF
ncbi:MAG: sugar ABC transporter permease [Clostridia bacterium]|nr:sugar ABC transporter permease [Clostridia bacterium]MBQ9480943.1 sugar ABC transporter permease [Clostridia bacterium]